jgi:TetR/AcrR family transcriptional regulator, repressor for uid operon
VRTRNTNLNAEKRKAILEAASSCFVKNGFHSTSMKDVCIRANMSPGTLYHYFDSKSDIIQGIIAAEAELTVALLAPMTVTTNILQALSDVLDILASEVSADDLALHTEISAEILREPHLREAQLKVEQISLDIVMAAICRAQTVNTISSKLVAKPTAKLILALIDGLLWRATLEGPESLKEYIPEAKKTLGQMLGAKS